MIVTDKKILIQISHPTTMEEVNNLNLVFKLRNANETAWIDGCGLAAIQIGIPLRFAWFKYKDREEVLLNPNITFKIGEVEDYEGCLSIPNNYFKVKRAYQIEYISGGKIKKAKGFKAKIIQHEIDHMDGILINSQPQVKEETDERH